MQIWWSFTKYIEVQTQTLFAAAIQSEKTKRKLNKNHDTFFLVSKIKQRKRYLTKLTFCIQCFFFICDFDFDHNINSYLKHGTFFFVCVNANLPIPNLKLHMHDKSFRKYLEQLCWWWLRCAIFVALDLKGKRSQDGSAVDTAKCYWQNASASNHISIQS